LIARPKRIAAVAKALLRRTDAGRRKVRLLGVSASTLMPSTILQLELFDEI
jgi:nucleotidyltransferase/DNA polymerase involved in DNA repair